jgi:predicted nucleic acid-binding protein
MLVRSPSISPTIEPLLLGLDAGELQVLLLARELAADWVLLDERLGRRVAQAMGLAVKGTIGVLLTAFHAGLMDRDTCLEAAHSLTSSGIRVHPAVLSWLANELQRS